jgi:hypothetical protein
MKEFQIDPSRKFNSTKTIAPNHKPCATRYESLRRSQKAAKMKKPTAQTVGSDAPDSVLPTERSLHENRTKVILP